MITQHATAIKPMTFVPAQPDITRNIGGVTYALTGCTVKTWGFAHTFASRSEAEAYIAVKLAQQGGYDAFFAGRDCQPPVLTKELSDAWVEGWNDAHAVGQEYVRSQWRAEDEAVYAGAPDPDWKHMQEWW